MHFPYISHLFMFYRHCGVSLKIKVQYYVLSWHLVKLEELQMVQLQIPFTTLLLQIRSHRQTTLLIRRITYSSCLSPSSSFQIPTSPQDYSNKPIVFSCGIGDTSPSWYYKDCFPQALLFSVSKCNPWHAVSPSPRWWVAVINELLSMSSVQCWVLCVQPSP